MHRHGRLIALAGTVLGTACRRGAPPRADSTAAPTPPPAQIAALFHCDDGTMVEADFRNDTTPAVVVLTIGDERITLPRQRSADGARYADSTNEFWNTGHDASFSRSGSKTTCHTGLPAAAARDTP